MAEDPKVTVEELLASMHRLKELRNEFIKAGGCDMFVCSSEAWEAIRKVTQPAQPPPNSHLVGHYTGIPVLVADTQKEVLSMLARAALEGKRVKLIGWNLTYNPYDLDPFIKNPFNQPG